jgi:Na+/H+-translocating membrane pyrophosphatase
MRGGALPALAWAVILGLLLAANWVWAGDRTQIATFGFAVLVIALVALALVLRDRTSLRRGAPSPASKLASEPDISGGAALAAIALATIAFGITFGHFVIYFGCGVLVAAAGRLALELRAERRSLARRRQRPPATDPADREGAP